MENHETSPKYSAEVRERAVRMVFDHAGDHPSQWAAIASIAGKIGCSAQTLTIGVRRAERDAGKRPGLTTDEGERLKSLEREVRELRQANAILRKASHILPRRSSTADRSHDGVYRSVSVRVRGRADLQGAADRPVDLLRSRRASTGARTQAGTHEA